MATHDGCFCNCCRLAHHCRRCCQKTSPTAVGKAPPAQWSTYQHPRSPALAASCRHTVHTICQQAADPAWAATPAAVGHHPQCLMLLRDSLWEGPKPKPWMCGRQHMHHEQQTRECVRRATFTASLPHLGALDGCMCCAVRVACKSQQPVQAAPLALQAAHGVWPLHSSCDF